MGEKKGAPGLTLQDWLGADNKLGADIWTKKYRIGDETLDEWLDRVSGVNTAPEGDEEAMATALEIRQAIADKKFLYGGRTLTNRGRDGKGSLSNCYSRGYLADNLEDLLQAVSDIGRTFKSQGGQGISLSHMRPAGAPVNGGYVSDGIVPFMELYNQTTASISQGGSRKGALIMTLDAWHKEAETFIKIKSEAGKIEKANLSLEIDDEFMEAVKKYYETGEVVKKTIHRTYDGGEVVYEVTPIELYKLMIEKAWDWGEPGCIYVNRFRNYNIMENDPDYRIETCNPCFAGGERLLTLDGYKTFEELDGKNVEICGADGLPSESRVWCSGVKKTVKVSFSDGTSMTCTPDHRFMLEDGTECMAEDLCGKSVKTFFPKKDALVAESVEPAGERKVYDFSEPRLHWGVVNGMVVHNCGKPFAA